MDKIKLEEIIRSKLKSERWGQSWVDADPAIILEYFEDDESNDPIEAINEDNNNV